MLDKDFQLITKKGTCSRGNRGYSASCPIKIKMALNKTTGRYLGFIYVSKFCKQFIDKHVNVFYNEKKNYFAIALAENGGVKCSSNNNKTSGIICNTAVVEMMYKAFGIEPNDNTLHLMSGKHDEEGNFIVMYENKLTIVKSNVA